MASPQVAGAQRCWRASSRRHGGRPRDRLLSSADRIASLQNKVQSGRLNLGAALRGAATVPLASSLPIAGKKLAITDVAPGDKSKLALSAKDFSIGPPMQGGASDPTLHGGELVVRNPETGATLRVPLEAPGWRFAKKAYLYEGTTGCRVVLKAGALSAKCKGLPRASAEATAQGELAVELVLARPVRARTSAGRSRDFRDRIRPCPPRASIRPPRPRRRRSAPD
jgi:hypothetical protein